MLGVIAHAINPRTWEAGASGAVFQGQPGVQSDIQDSQGYPVSKQQHQKYFRLLNLIKQCLTHC